MYFCVHIFSKLLFLFLLYNFFVLGKEYVCIVRLHETVNKEDDLAKVSVNN